MATHTFNLSTVEAEQADLFKFKGSLVYMGFRPAMDTLLNQGGERN